QAPQPQVEAAQPEAPAPREPAKPAPVEARAPAPEPTERASRAEEAPRAASPQEPAPAAPAREAAPARPTHPPSAADRFAHAHLPPGVLRRGNTAAPSAGTALSDAARARIVAEHAASRPKRREIRGPAAIGPAARPQGRLGKKRLAPGKKAQKTEITVPSEKKRLIRIE